MARTVLTIDPKYCPTWGFWEGTRELVQNAKDAEEFAGNSMEIEHSSRSDKLTISSQGANIDPATLLLLGATSKGDGNQRGRFGEGFVIGVLALIRAGHAVTIYNGDEVWRPVIEVPPENAQFAGRPVLVFNTRKLQNTRTAFTVEVENVTKEIWTATKKLFLFLTPPKADDVVEVNRGKILLDPEMVGRVFARGIFVCKVDNLKAGYDLNDVEMDRDRRMINEWTLQYRLGELWSQAVSAEPEKLSEQLYNFAKVDSSETKMLRSHSDQKLVKALRAHFEKEHGEDIVAVANMSESRELEALGAKTAVVPETLKTLLEMSGKTAAGAREKLRSAVTRVLAWTDLTEVEQGLCTAVVERFAKEYQIVEFADSATRGRLLGDEGKKDRTLAIDRRTLASAEETLEMVARLEISRTEVDPVNFFVDVLAREISR